MKKAKKGNRAKSSVIQQTLKVTPDTVLIMLALISALFFNGDQLEYLSLSLTLLIIWFGRIAWRTFSRGIRFPQSPLTFWLTIYWGWLGISVIWSEVFYISAINLWWLGALPLVFWLFTMEPDRDHVWPRFFNLLWVVGIVLAFMAIYQHYALNESPRATFLTHNSTAAFFNLIAIPIAAQFLFTRPAQREKQWLSAITLGVLFFAVAITASRGAMLSAVAGLVVLAVIANRFVPKKKIAIVALIVLGAYILASLSSQGFVTDRLNTILTPGHSGQTRFVIWEQTWKMIMDSSWWGSGIGTFWMFYPRFRDPTDSSGGYYVHNDYLQIWFEAGLPGLLLLIAVLISTLYLFLRALHRRKRDAAAQIEMAGLFAGLLAIALHSIVDFNLYILPILIVSGIFLSRFHSLAIAKTRTKVLVVKPSQFFGRRPYRVITTLVLIIPFIYFAALAFSVQMTNKAHALAAEGKWIETDQALNQASILMPSSDYMLLSHADLYRQAISAIPADGVTHKKNLFRASLMLLERAERLNPLRPQIFLVRGLLYHENPQLVAMVWAEQAARSYEKAISLDPRYHGARTIYATLLLEQGKKDKARELLEAGSHYWYFPSPVLLPYYALTARLRREAGDLEGAQELESVIVKIQAIQQAKKNPPGSPTRSVSKG